MFVFSNVMVGLCIVLDVWVDLLLCYIGDDLLVWPAGIMVLEE